ncbi:MAG: hypothetical protein JPMHGGIA_00840 [Saprospiraceae bacterium]|jgi:hypothetical protein|nr:hypothetical protein [Saprospiraceae bacterium]
MYVKTLLNEGIRMVNPSRTGFCHRKNTRRAFVKIPFRSQKEFRKATQERAIEAWRLHTPLVCKPVLLSSFGFDLKHTQVDLTPWGVFRGALSYFCALLSQA